MVYINPYDAKTHWMNAITMNACSASSSCVPTQSELEFFSTAQLVRVKDFIEEIIRRRVVPFVQPDMA